MLPLHQEREQSINPPARLKGGKNSSFSTCCTAATLVPACPVDDFDGAAGALAPSRSGSDAALFLLCCGRNLSRAAEGNGHAGPF